MWQRDVYSLNGANKFRFTEPILEEHAVAVRVPSYIVSGVEQLEEKEQDFEWVLGLVQKSYIEEQSNVRMYDVLFDDGNTKCIPSGFTEHILRHEKDAIQPTNIVEPTCNISSDDDSEDEDGVRDGDDSWPDTHEDDLAEQAAEWEAWAHSLAGAAAVPGLESTSVMAILPAGATRQLSVGVNQKMPSGREEGIGSLPGEVETAGLVDRAGSALSAPHASMPTGQTAAPNALTTQVSAQTGQHVSVAKLPTFGTYNQSGVRRLPDSVGIAGMAAVDATDGPSSEHIAEYSSAKSLRPQIPAQRRQQVRLATKTEFGANTQFRSRNSPAPPDVAQLAAEDTGDQKQSVPTSQSQALTAEASTETPEAAIEMSASPSNARLPTQKCSGVAQESSAPTQQCSGVAEQSSVPTIQKIAVPGSLRGQAPAQTIQQVRVAKKSKFGAKKHSAATYSVMPIVAQQSSDTYTAGPLPPVFGDVAAGGATGDNQSSAKIDRVQAKNKSATVTAKKFGGGHGARQKLKSAGEEQMEFLPALGGIDEVLGLTAGAGPTSPIAGEIGRVRREKIGEALVAESEAHSSGVGRPRGKRSQTTDRSKKVVSKKLKWERRGGIGDLPAGGETHSAGSRGRHLTVEAGIVQLGEGAGTKPAEPAQPARAAAGNMFFLVFFWGIFVCFCFWWKMSHHVRVQ